MKVWNYMMIMITMMIFLYFLGFNPSGTQATLEDAGIEINTTTGELIQSNPADSAWYSNLFNLTDGVLFVIFAGGAILIGILTRQFDWKIVLLPFFTTFIVKFVSFGWSVINLANDTGETWLIAIVATVFLPLSVMFIFSVVEWFGGGND